MKVIKKDVQFVRKNILNKFIRPSHKTYKSETLENNKLIIKTENSSVINSDHFYINKKESLNCFQKINESNIYDRNQFKEKQSSKLKMVKSNTISNMKIFQKKRTKKIRDSNNKNDKPNRTHLRGVQTQKKLVNTANASHQEDEHLNFSQKFHKNRSSTFINNLINSDVELDQTNMTIHNTAYWYQKENKSNLPTSELDILYIRLFSKCFVYLSKIENLKIKLHKENIESMTYSFFRIYRHKETSFIGINGLQKILECLNISLSSKSLHKLFWYLSKFRDTEAMVYKKPSFNRKISMKNIYNRTPPSNHFLSYSEFRELFSSFKILIPEIYLESDWNCPENTNKITVAPVISSLMRQIVLLKSRFIFDLSEIIQQLRKVSTKELFWHLFLDDVSLKNISTPSISNLPSFKNNYINQLNIPHMRQSLEINKVSSYNEVTEHPTLYHITKPSKRYGTVKSLSQSKSHNNLLNNHNIVITDFFDKKSMIRNGSLDKNIFKENNLTVDILRQFLDHFNVRYLNEDLMLIMNLMGAKKGVLLEEKFNQFINSSVWNI